MPVLFGKQVRFTVNGLPVHAAKWVGKIVYDTVTTALYYADAAQWVKISDEFESLDDAYNNGRTITVDAGAVEFAAIPVNGNRYAPIRLVDLADTPNSNLQGGDLAVVNGRLYSYDSTRSKWLSVQRSTLVFGRRFADGQYLIFADCFITRYTGYICHADTTIVSIKAKCDSGNLNKIIRLRRNGLFINIDSFTLALGVFSNNNANIDLNDGDILQIFADPAGQASRNLTVQLEVAYRA